MTQRAKAARAFDDACKGIDAPGRRLREHHQATNAAIGVMLAPANGGSPVGRGTIMDWRHGRTDVPAWAYLAARDLARGASLESRGDVAMTA